MGESGAVKVAGRGRLVEVAPERVEPWLRGFTGRHGATDWAATPEQVVVTAAAGVTPTFRTVGWLRTQHEIAGWACCWSGWAAMPQECSRGQA